MLDKNIKRHIDDKTRSNLLVIGMPGSGKTYNLVRVVEYLVQKKGIPPEKILVLSFNRKWSKIIREELALMMERSFLEIPVETFFSFSKDLILHSRIILDEAPFRVEVLNSIQQWELLSDILNGLDKKDYPLTCKITSNNESSLNSFQQEAFDFILRAQENLLSPLTLSNKFTPFFDKTLSELVGIYSRYIKRLQSINKFNYGRILTEAARYLGENPKIKEHHKQLYKYIIVDELHEINTAQLSILRHMARDNLIMFGNDDQSIYSFRGSMVDNFNRIYKGLDKKDIVLLDKDYRCQKDISLLCENFIKKNSNRITKHFQEAIPEDKAEVMVSKVDAGMEGLDRIADKLVELTQVHGLSLHDICIVVKGTGYKTSLIEEMLKKRDIPYIIRGTRNVLGDPGVKRLLDLARIIHLHSTGRDDSDTVSKKDILLENILLTGPKKIDPLLVKGLKGKESIFKVIDAGRKDDTKRWPGRISEIFEIIEAFKDRLDETAYNFITGLYKEDMLSVSGYRTAETNTDENLSDFFESLKSFTLNNEGSNTLKDYLEFLDSMSPRHFLEEIEEATETKRHLGRLNVMSFHQVKGFEFEAVFIPFMNRDYIPAEFLYPQTYDMQIFRYFVNDKILDRQQLAERHLEEERKLFYNGLTRAKRFLFVTCEKDKEPSIFFDELNKIIDEQKGLTGSVSRSFGNKPSEQTPWYLRKKANIYTYRISNSLRIDPSGFADIIFELFSKYHPRSWFDNISETKNKRGLLEELDFIFSFSSLDTYKKCPAKFKYKYILGLREESDLALVLGAAYHRILSEFIKGRDHTWQALEKIIGDAFKRSEFDLDHLEKEHMTDAVQNLRSYFEQWMPAHPEKSIVEKDFYMMMDGYRVRGRIDQINFPDNESIELVDFKTSSQKLSSKDLEDEIQLRLYKLALPSIKGFENLSGKNIKLIYHYITKTSKPIQVVPEQGKDSEDFIRSITDIARDAEKERFRPDDTDKFQCYRCSYRKLCKK